MRKLLVITPFLLFAGIALGQTSQRGTVDIEAEKVALNKIVDEFESAMKGADVPTLLSFIDEEALICGTDPSEFWNKQQFIDFLAQNSNNTLPDPKYIGDRKIKVAPEGNSAIVVTQLMMAWSPKIPLRWVYHFVKTNDNWRIFLSNVAFIPDNEDVKKLNEAID